MNAATPSFSAADDGPDRLTRLVALLVIPFLLAAFVILYLQPESSGTRFAWEIRPALTAAWMGAGYLGGAWFFLRVALARRWGQVAAGFWPVTTFTWAMLLTTVLHWSRFELPHWPFLIWLVLYLVTPFLIPWLWWRNQRRVGRPVVGPEELLVPAGIRLGMLAVAGLMLISCLVAFVAPHLLVRFWPWALTPLTARVMGGWFALMGVGGLTMWREPRWSGWRYEVESIIFVWHLLMLVGAIWRRADFKPGGGWFIGAEAAVVLLLAVVYFYMTRQQQRGQQ
ncbi:MAG: hypothetical protein KDE04_09780 [Anaerolineales bacterium]|nr:hypothetical protein [Anaerolineales bacterium]